MNIKHSPIDPQRAVHCIHSAFEVTMLWGGSGGGGGAVSPLGPQDPPMGSNVNVKLLTIKYNDYAMWM